jgi:hypothetical protein
VGRWLAALHTSACSRRRYGKLSCSLSVNSFSGWTRYFCLLGSPAESCYFSVEDRLHPTGNCFWKSPAISARAGNIRSAPFISESSWPYWSECCQ